MAAKDSQEKTRTKDVMPQDANVIQNTTQKDEINNEKSRSSLAQTCIGSNDNNSKKPHMKTKIKVSLAQAKRPPPVEKHAPMRTKVAKQNESSQLSVDKVFQASDESDEEEMPLEARIRMRNIGRFTPTSAGPNSFGKTNQGFVDTGKLWKKKMEEAGSDIKQPPKN